jgi:hypothetical protein
MGRHVLCKQYGYQSNAVIYGVAIGPRPHLMLDVQNMPKWGQWSPQRVFWFLWGQICYSYFLISHPCYRYLHYGYFCSCMFIFPSSPVSFKMDDMYSLSVSLKYTCRLMPSIWTIFRFCSWMRITSWSHSCMSKAEIRGLAVSNVKTIVLHRAAISLLHRAPSSVTLSLVHSHALAQQLSLHFEG